MPLKPLETRTKLCDSAVRAGHTVSRENGKTVIDGGTIVLSFDFNTDIVDQDGKVYTVADAFNALNLAVV